LYNIFQGGLRQKIISSANHKLIIHCYQLILLLSTFKSLALVASTGHVLLNLACLLEVGPTGLAHGFKIRLNKDNNQVQATPVKRQRPVLTFLQVMAEYQQTSSVGQIKIKKSRLIFFSYESPTVRHQEKCVPTSYAQEPPSIGSSTKRRTLLSRN
jgi:hypothetical protein